MSVPGKSGFGEELGQEKAASVIGSGLYSSVELVFGYQLTETLIL